MKRNDMSGAYVRHGKDAFTERFINEQLLMFTVGRLQNCYEKCKEQSCAHCVGQHLLGKQVLVQIPGVRPSWEQTV